jgi:DnaK suppressor protein
MSKRKEAIMKLRQVLIKRRDALRRALAGDLSSLKELREQSGGDLVDFALDSAQDEISSQLAEVESRELALIEQALERMRHGTYGVCEVTGRPIPLARLQALPYATMCIEAQREAERQGNRGGNSPDWSRVGNVETDEDDSDADAVLNDLELDAS